MPRGPKRIPPALKHGAYSEVTLLPGEDPDEFAELHRGLIAEFAPNGRSEEETVASIARLMWRRQNLAKFQIGQLSNQMFEVMEESIDKSGFARFVSELNKPLNLLMKELDIEERLDSMIERLIKRLLMLRGLKSITSSTAIAAPAAAQKASSRSRAV
jgi:hypothetical protein